MDILNLCILTCFVLETCLTTVINMLWIQMQTYSTESAVDNVRGIMKKFSSKEVKLGR